MLAERACTVRPKLPLLPINALLLLILFLPVSSARRVCNLFLVSFPSKAWLSLVLLRIGVVRVAQPHIHCVLVIVMLHSLRLRAAFLLSERNLRKKGSACGTTTHRHCEDIMISLGVTVAPGTFGTPFYE